MQEAICTRAASPRSSRVAEFSRENSAEGTNLEDGRKGTRSARSRVAKRSKWMGTSESRLGGKGVWSGRSPVANRSK